MSADALSDAWTGSEPDSLAALLDGTWTALSLEPFTSLGINTVEDFPNRLAEKSDANLFSHDDVTPGTGNLR